jgi:hypothetical protein
VSQWLDASAQSQKNLSQHTGQKSATGAILGFLNSHFWGIYISPTPRGSCTENHPTKRGEKLKPAGT